MKCGNELRMHFRSVFCELEEGHEGDHKYMDLLSSGARSLYWPTARQKMIDDISDLLQGRR